MPFTGDGKWEELELLQKLKIETNYFNKVSITYND